MNENERIEQFRKMAQANPDDDLAHFAFGQALIEAGRFAEAAPVLRHVVKLSPGYSRAYVLLGRAQVGVGDAQAAIETWKDGYTRAMNRGDLLPANEMKALLAERGEKPSLDLLVAGDYEEDDGREPGEGEVRDLRTKRVGKRLTENPFGDDIGAFIVENVSQESWEAWLDMSVKVINELRLDLGDPWGQQVYDEQMRDFLDLPAHLFEGRTYG